MMCGTTMVTDGLPFGRRERGTDHDILAGADFLSILMKTSFQKEYSHTTTTSTTLGPTTIIQIEDYEIHYDPRSNIVRPSRSTPLFAQTSTEEHNFSVSDRNVASDLADIAKDAIVLAVHVSSSVGKGIQKQQSIHSNNFEETTLNNFVSFAPTTEVFDQTVVASQEHPTIVAKASKSELSVEEGEPITKDENLDLEYSGSYPARVQSLPSQSHSSYDPTAGFLNQHKESTSPYQQTVIYHDNPNDPGRARSISYSSIIQALPQTPEETEKPVQHERHERHYNGAQSAYVNNFDENMKRKQNDTRGFPSASENKSLYTTGVSPATESWMQAEQSLKKLSITTERNWETQEKPYVPPPPEPSHVPKIYGKPEQNYEVEEIVSVVTNGRTHGVQPSAPPKTEKKPDDNQKFGYVVEGKNYRKYRVEERTADGFIVGEYGVVSHNDGSLRGVRYTADGTINPKVISEALMKFLSL